MSSVTTILQHHRSSLHLSCQGTKISIATITACKMPPRIIRLSSPLLRQTPVSSFRITISRCAYSTSSDDEVIKTQQVPAPGSGNIRVLLLNRPDARNALSNSLVDALVKHVQSISAEGGVGPTRALVIGSTTDPAFCAGADLKERAGMSKEEYVIFLILNITMCVCVGN